ncbi:MAG: DUF3098 domain-containing protein [Ignavibacteriae bacterium]|nr:DUF3098 domain-containing protein [Ignavibacteriota bacterium]
MAKVNAKSKKQSAKVVSPFKNYWLRENYILFGVGMAIVIIGFLLMAQGPWDNPLSLTVSPLVLLVAYLVVFPLSILYKKRKPTLSEDVSSED